jgi:hypothetical protein
MNRTKVIQYINETKNQKALCSFYIFFTDPYSANENALGFYP